MFGGKQAFSQAQATETLHAAIDQASTRARTIVDQAASLAHDGAQKARETSANLGAQASERFDHAAKSIERDMAPSVREVAFQAATVALELWQAAREKTEQAIEAGRTDLPDAASHAFSAVERRAEEAGEMAKTASKHAASATADAGKNTGAILIWAGAATGIVLFGILKKERREQVLKYAQSALSITRDLIADYKGQDGRFDAPAA
jgi:Fe2+ transport system protein B